MGLDSPGTPEGYNMYAANPGNVPGATTLPNDVPEYHWWNGCSPTAAGMLFAYWDTYLGREDLYAGDSSNWDMVDMDMANDAHYDNEHNIVASLGHRQAGQEQGLEYGTWDRNGNGLVDDQASWDCLADFMLTEDGGTSRSDMAQGFVDYAAWDDPTTPTDESYDATAATVMDPTWQQYTAEINAGYPVHVGIPGHSILGFGYCTLDGVDYVINWTTWGGDWDGMWGLVEFNEVYGFTTLRIAGRTPEPASFAIWGLIGSMGLVVRRHRR